MKKRNVIALILVSLIVIPSMLMASGQSDSEGSEKKVVLNILTRAAGSDPRGVANAELFKMYLAQNPNVEINDESVNGAQAFYDKLMSRIASGEVPNFFLNYGASQLKPLVLNDQVLDIQPALKADSKWSGSLLYMSSLEELYQFKGIDGIYGLPRDIYCNGIFYNKTIFKEHNVEPPETMKEFLELSDYFKLKGYVPMAFGPKTVWRQGHLYTSIEMKMYGDQLIWDLAERRKKYTGPEMIDVMTVLKEWQERGIFGENIVTVDYGMEKAMFFNGESPMHFDGPWFMQEAAADKYEGGEMFGFAPFPYFADKPEFRYSFMGGANGGYSLGKSDDEAINKAAIELLKFYTSPEATEYKINAYGGIFPVEHSIDIKTQSTLFQEFMTVLNTAEALRIEVEMYDELTQLMEIMRNGLLGMFAGSSPMETMQQVQEEIDNNG